MKNPLFLKIPSTNRFFILLLALFVSVAFHNCLQNDFIGDDKALFSDNQFYKSLDNFSKIFTQELVMAPSRISAFKQNEVFSGCISYRPVTAATFFLDYALWKNNSLGHHLSNIILHFLAVVLVFYFILRISDNQTMAFLTASFFAVHPIQSEVVNASSYRSDILLAIFYLGAVLSYLNYRTAKNNGSWLLIAAAAYFLALFSKETAVTFPVVILICDHFFSSVKNFRTILWEKRWLYLLLAAITAFYLVVYFILIPNAFYLQSAPQAQHGVAQIVLMLKIFAQYLMVFIFPSQISVLPPLYAPPIFPLHAGELIVPLFVGLISLALGIYYCRQNKLITFGLLWFFLNYFPVSGFFPLLNPMAFRFLYLPSVGFFLLAAVCIQAFIARLKRKKFELNISFFLQGALIGLLIALTIANNTFFRSNFVACREMIRRYPDSSRPYWILGFDSYLDGNFGEAIKYLQKHLQAALNNPFISSDKEKFMTYHLLSKVSADPDAAIGYLKKAVMLNPGFPVLYLDLSKNYIVKKDYPAALVYAKYALELDPQLSSAYVYIAHINIEEGDLVQAAKVLAFAKEKFSGDVNLVAVEKYLEQKKRVK